MTSYIKTFKRFVQCDFYRSVSVADNKILLKRNLEKDDNGKRNPAASGDEAGAGESPVGMFCITLQPFHNIELIRAPPAVAACVRRVANEVKSPSWSPSGPPGPALELEALGVS